MHLVDWGRLSVRPFVRPPARPSTRPFVRYAFSFSAVSTCLLTLRGRYWLLFKDTQDHSSIDLISHTFPSFQLGTEAWDVGF